MDPSEAIRRLVPRSFRGVIHRIYDPDHGLLETIGSYRSGGRWNRKEKYGALYTSLSRETAFAEARRSAQKRNRKPSELGRRDHVAIRIRLTRILDLTLPQFYDSLGISSAALLNNDSLCLNVADEARKLGCEALLVPSATGSGTNLVIYQDLLLPGWKLEEIEREEDIVLAEPGSAGQ